MSCGTEKKVFEDAYDDLLSLQLNMRDELIIAKELNSLNPESILKRIINSRSKHSEIISKIMNSNENPGLEILTKKPVISRNNLKKTLNKSLNITKKLFDKYENNTLAILAAITAENTLILEGL